MTSSDASADRPIGTDTRIILLSILSSLLIGAVAISNQSLWIDEAHSAGKAMQPSLASWWTAMVQEKGSDLQMPFYMFYLWGWCKVFGVSEVALRAANLPWFVLGVLALIRTFRQDRHLRLCVAVLALTNSFLWYYIDEARPYIVLFAFSALTASCLFRLRQDPITSPPSASWFRWFCIGVVGICATNLIAVPWAIGAIAAFIFWCGYRLTFKTATRFLFSFALTGCALIALCIYYFWSLQLGTRASDVGRTTFATLGFVWYELLGLAGLGPGRITLREEGWRTLIAYVPALSLGAIALFSLCFASTEELRKKIIGRDFIFFGLTTILPVAFLIFAAIATHLRLLGRHFTPLLPFLLVFLGIGLKRVLFANAKWVRGLGVIAVVVLLISAVEIRFAPRHQRDDYRTASAEARHALVEQKKVWWAADASTASYYGVPLDSPDLTLSSNLSDRSFETLTPPDLVLLSKPDIYDRQGKIDNYLRAHDFKVTRVLPAFQIYERPSDRR